MRDTGNDDFVRINKKEARNRYNDGKAVFLMPCNIRFDNAWVQLYTINKKSGDDFDKLVNHYEYYNCDHERGYYASFYK